MHHTRRYVVAALSAMATALVASQAALLRAASPQSAATTPSTTTYLSAKEPEPSNIARRAIDAALWGMPAVSMAAVRRSLAGVGAGYNEVLYFSNVLEARHELLTANNTTPYVAVVLDLHSGPMVVEVPAASAKIALFGSVIDSFQVPIADVGPTGDDKAKAESTCSCRRDMQARVRTDISSFLRPRTSCTPGCGRSSARARRSGMGSPMP